MLDAIQEKLEAILGEPPRTEADVVYVLVEIRKFLEREGKAKEDEFSTLKFFCDWVLHVELEGTGARKVLASLDPEIGVSGPVNLPEVKPSSALYRLLSLESLLEEIMRFCTENKLPTDWAFKPTMWRECMRLYGQVVMDCPLAITRKGASTRYIKQLTIMNMKNSQDHLDKRAFSWDWRFELSDGINFTLPHKFSSPSPSYNPSRPSTEEFGFK
ncbi:MAG: hypothetical protein ABSA41_18055 [Terriglobia bacterium]|jgi:hypothetical protein